MGQTTTIQLSRHASRIVIVGLLGVAVAVLASGTAPPPSPAAWMTAVTAGVAFGIVMSQPMHVSHRGHLVRIDAGAFVIMVGIARLSLPVLLAALLSGEVVAWVVARRAEHLPVLTPTAATKASANLATNLLAVSLAYAVHVVLAAVLGWPPVLSIAAGVVLAEVASAAAVTFIIRARDQSLHALLAPLVHTPPLWLTILVGAMMVRTADSTGAAAAWLLLGAVSLWLLGRHQERQENELEQLRALSEVTRQLAMVDDHRALRETLVDRARQLTHATVASLDIAPSPEPSISVRLDGTRATWLTVHDRRDGGEVFRPVERELLGRLAAVGGMAMERLRLTEELRHAATHDQLTGVLSRRGLEQQWEPATRRAGRHGRSLGVVYVDLDHFKQINDTQGHAAGDAVLVDVAGRLQGVARDADFVCRMGGDEFLLVAEDVADSGAVDALAARVRAVLAAGRPIAASVGVALHPEDGGSLDEVITAADARMYDAKRAGRAVR